MLASPTVRRAVLLVLLTALVYAPFVIDAGWIWDDDDYVTANPALTAPGGLVAIWTDPSATPQFYPLTHTTFWVETRLFGFDPAAFRAINIALHAISCVLLAAVLRRLRVPGAWLAAAVFAVHPVQVESVAWITERKNVLCGVLYLGSLLCWIRAFALDRDPGATVSERRFPVGFAAAGLALFGLALLAKTIAATLPITIAILLWWKRVPIRGREVAYLGTMLVCGALLGSLTAHLEHHQIGTEGAEWGWSFADRLRIAGRAWWFYLGKLVWPSNLTFIYPRWDPSTWGAAAWLWPASATTTLLALLASAPRIGRGPAAAVLHYTAAIGPALGIVDVYPMRYSFVADHFAYLALLGPIALAAAAASRFAATRLSPAMRATAAGVLVLALAMPGWARVPSFSGPEALWQDTLRRNPRAWIAHAHLGILDADRGDLVAAKGHFERVLELYPANPGVRNNLGVVMIRLGRPEAAREVLEEAVARTPDDSRAWMNLADVRRDLGDLPGAEAAWRRARALRPSDPEPAVREIASLLERGRLDEAASGAAAASRSFPADARLVHLVALAEVAAGRAEAAEIAFRRAASLDPRSAEIRYHLGNLLAGAGRYDEAIEAYRSALRLDPRHAAAQRNLDEARRRAAAPGRGL